VPIPIIVVFFFRSGLFHDDQSLSDDSLSTLSTFSDLDYNINIDVLLPNGSMQKTSIAAQ